MKNPTNRKGALVPSLQAKSLERQDESYMLEVWNVRGYMREPVTGLATEANARGFAEGLVAMDRDIESIDIIKVTGKLDEDGRIRYYTYRYSYAYLARIWNDGTVEDLRRAKSGRRTKGGA